MTVVRWLAKVLAGSPADPRDRVSSLAGPRDRVASLPPTTFEDHLSWAEEVLGSSITTSDHSWPHNRSAVLELSDELGDRWFLKRPGDSTRFEREVYAYEKYLPALGDGAPRYVASNSRHQTLLISAVAGHLVFNTDDAIRPEVHRQAGEWLARLHASAPPEPAPGLGGQLAEQLEVVLARANDVLEPFLIDYVRDANSGWARLIDAVTVPCHRDYWARNWIVNGDGVLRVIDFGLSRHDLVVRDFSRLAHYSWSTRPHLKDAFLDGYGRNLTSDEEEQLRGYLARSFARTILRARESGNSKAEARIRRKLTRTVQAERS